MTFLTKPPGVMTKVLQLCKVSKVSLQNLKINLKLGLIWSNFFSPLNLGSRLSVFQNKAGGRPESCE